MVNMLDDLGNKNVPALNEILEVLREEDVQHQLEQLGLTEALARLAERREVNRVQINKVTDELATRNPVV